MFAAASPPKRWKPISLPNRGQALFGAFWRITAFAP